MTAVDVRGLVASQVQEAYDLDFKEFLYGTGDSEKRKLAGDVAALANTAGGVIVLGVQEDEQACAVATPGVALSDAEEQRMRQIVASLVAPMPTFDVLRLPDASQPTDTDGTEPELTRGFFVVAVPRSPGAPHAVLVNDGLRYPKRNGSTTRYLSEPEVAAAYRDRLFGGQRQNDRVKEVEGDAVSRLDTTENSWVSVTLVPDLPGDMIINGDVYKDFQRQIVGTQPTIVDVGISVRTVRVRRRRLLADGTTNDSAYARWVSLDLHTDDSGAFALPVMDLRERRQVQPSDEWEPEPRLIDDESIAFALLSALAYLARYARDQAAAGGTALIRATLVPDRPIEIGHGRSFSESRSTHPLSAAPAPAEVAVPLDVLAESGPALVATAAVLLDELGQAFGIPEMGQLTEMVWSGGDTGVSAGTQSSRSGQNGRASRSQTP